MLISLQWIRDYVELPAGLDPLALGEVFTRTTAEVDGVHRLHVGAQGLIAARVVSVGPAPGKTLRQTTLEIGNGQIQTVTATPKLAAGDLVIYAPPGASLKELGRIGTTEVGGVQSAGMILAAESLGISAAGQEAVFLANEFKPGDALPADLFDDWLIEIDNKSLTNRPDLWGHYGIAREIAAITKTSLRPFGAIVPGGERSSQATNFDPVLNGDGGVRIPIVLADAMACPRYSAVVVEGVTTQPAPLWMQLRLGHVGQRPISGLVDLTNYIMMDLGQPMHAFDADKVRQIEVDWARDGEVFRTLDGVERRLIKSDLMIKSKGKSVALAGVMGGLETEMSATTRSLLLESANFNGAVIRRTASRLGLRTDASARFEKSLDPANTVLGIARFVQLARPMFPALRVASALSDAYPHPASPLTVRVAPQRVARTIGRDVSQAQARSLLEPLGFSIAAAGDEWTVNVPGFRATGDISIEADLMEELARAIGYDNIAPAMPQTTSRTFEINALHELEQSSLRSFTGGQAFHEIHGYLWFDDAWLEQIGFDPGPALELCNPAGAGLHRLRTTLVPGLLAAAARNRFHYDSLALVEVGSVFQASSNAEFRHLGLLLARRGKNNEAALNDQLRLALARWSWEQFGRDVQFSQAVADTTRPWEDAARTATCKVGGNFAGRTGMIDLPLRRRMDDHLGSWGMVWAEIHLSGLAALPRRHEALTAIPEFPHVELDFTLETPRTSRYEDLVLELGRFAHPLLRSVRFLASYEGEKDSGRSLTFRCELADPKRTLTEADTHAFQKDFETFLSKAGLKLKT